LRKQGLSAQTYQNWGLKMPKYTKIGHGDFSPEYHAEIDACLYCGHHGDTDYDNQYCGFKHWFLMNVGAVKRHILEWQSNGYDVADNLARGGWFENMTPSTAERYRRAVKNLAC